MIIGLTSILAVKSIAPEIEIWFKIPFHFNFHAERESDVKMFVSLRFVNSEISITGCMNAWSLIPNYHTTPVHRTKEVICGSGLLEMSAIESC